MPSGTSARERFGDLAQQRRIALEPVLVEVLVAHGTRPQGERAREVRDVVDLVCELLATGGRHGVGSSSSNSISVSETAPFACSHASPMRS